MAKTRSRFRWVVISAVATVVLGGCSSQNDSTKTSGTAETSPPTAISATSAPAAAAGVETPIGDVPWPQVGPGWLLATWSPAPGVLPGQQPPAGQPTYETASTTLYLVDPLGGRYPITTFPPPGNGPSPTLVDWSGDGSHALFFSLGPASTVTEVDLHTGAQSTFAAGDGFSGSPRYSRPVGKAVLLSKSRNGSEPGSLERVDLSGKQQLAYPVGQDFEGEFLSTADGTQLVLGTSAGLTLMRNDGTVASTITIPGQTSCSPLRWWDGQANTTVLAQCEGADVAGLTPRRLWLVPIGGGAPKPLTAPNSGAAGQDLGDANAWQLPEGTFVQALGGCGFRYLAKLNADGTTTQVNVPNVDPSHSLAVVGVHDGTLNLQAMIGGCAPSQSLLTYDPATNTTTVLLGPPVNGGVVSDALPYPGQQ